MTPEKEPTLFEVIYVGAMSAGLAALFQAIRASREHMNDPFSLRRFLRGVLSACAVGMLAGWLLTGLRVGRMFAAAIIGMSGYVGGPLLDLLYTEVKETLQAAFDGLQKWLSEGRWGRHGGE